MKWREKESVKKERKKERQKRRENEKDLPLLVVSINKRIVCMFGKTLKEKNYQ